MNFSFLFVLKKKKRLLGFELNEIKVLTPTVMKSPDASGSCGGRRTCSEPRIRQD